MCRRATGFCVVVQLQLRRVLRRSEGQRCEGSAILLPALEVLKNAQAEQLLARFIPIRANALKDARSVVQGVRENPDARVAKGPQTAH